jgi:hypothetical protein
MPKIDIPSGGWVSMREPSSITHGERKALIRAWEADKRDGVDKGIDFTESLIALFVEEWSLEGVPVPSKDRTVLDGLPVHDYDTLSHTVTEYQQRMYLKFDPDPDPKARTGLSSV